MIIHLAALAAGFGVLPQIDRNMLELQARAEALQPRAAAVRPARRSGPAPRRASAPGALNLNAITTICRAAGNEADPAAFIGRLSSAYSLSSDESASLRASCAAYLAGRADARRAAGGTY